MLKCVFKDFFPKKFLIIGNDKIILESKIYTIEMWKERKNCLFQEKFKLAPDKGAKSKKLHQTEFYFMTQWLLGGKLFHNFFLTYLFVAS